MKMPSFFSKKKVNSEVYLGLFLKEQEATGFVFEVANGSLVVLAKQTTAYSNGWENILEDIDQLLLELDKQSKLGLNEVIFFVYSYFINDVTKEIVQPYKDVIKSIVKNLDLKAMGYIECYEAIAAYLQSKEGSPLNAILVEFDKTNFGVFVYKGGKRVFAQNSARTNSFTDDFEIILKKARELTMLPSRLILYDSESIDTEVQNIRSKQWDANLFVQLPRVEVIKQQDLYQGLADIFMLQLNNALPAIAEEPMPEEASSAESTAESIVATPPPATNPGITPTAAPSEVMGFMIGQDVPESETPEDVPATEVENNADFEDESPVEPVKKPRFAFLGNIFRKPRFLNSKGGSKKKLLNFMWIPGLLLIILALFSMEFFFHKAVLTVYFPSQTLSKSIDIDANLDPSQGGFIVKEGTRSATMTETKSTTGQKQVGDKAKGTVTIHNFDDTDKTFSKGTTISSGNFSYTLDSDVKVASATEALVAGDFVKQPGKSNVTVTATDIGSDYNLDKGQRFKVGDLSSSLYFGVNDNPLTGGSKKNIQTVAKKDMDDLEKTVMDKANKDSSSISTQIPANQKLISQLTTTDLGDVTFSKEIGEESNSLTLKATVNTTYYYYDPDQFKQAIANEFKGDIENGYSLDKSQISYTVEDVKKNGDSIALTLLAQGKAMKLIARTDILSQVTGQTKDDLNKILKVDVGAAAYSVDISSPLFFTDGRMPFFRRNIELKVGSQ